MHNVGDLQDKIVACGFSLKAWEGIHFGNVTVQIRELRKKLDVVLEGEPTESNNNKRKQLELDLDVLLEKEEIK